jgi:DNA polymerase-3 subunit epsilon
VVPVPQPAKAGGTVCISGKLLSGSKKADYAKPLQAIGLVLVDDVVKDLSYLVVADPGAVTSKAEKARKFGIPILSEEQLKALIDKAGKPARRK